MLKKWYHPLKIHFFFLSDNRSAQLHPWKVQTEASKSGGLSKISAGKLATRNEKVTI